MSSSCTWILAWMVLAVLVVDLSCFCDRPYIRQPGATNSLSCNVVGEKVEIVCEIDGVGYQIDWYFTTTQAQAGNIAGLQPLQTNTNGIQLLSVLTTTVKSTLSINSFDRNQHSGFYWCLPDVVTIVTSGELIPSTILQIMPPLLAELDACSSAIATFSSSGNVRCAIGSTEPSPATVIVTFTNVIPTTMAPPPQTTAPPSTTLPEETTNAATIDITVVVPPTTSSSDDGVEVTTESSGGSSGLTRTAIIWFSVGAVALLLIVGAIILCVVAIARN